MCSAADDAAHTGSRPPQRRNIQREVAMIHQLRICLRICEIFEETKAAFHARFRDHAARIMRRHSFRILGMWEARAEWRTEFVYLLEWPDEATMRDTWAALM